MGPNAYHYEIYKYNKCGNGVIFNLKFRYQSVYVDDGAVKNS